MDEHAIARLLGGVPRSLRALGLGGLANLDSAPFVGEMPQLRSLSLRGCPALEAVPHGLAIATQLRSLTLSGCSSLLALPDSLGELGCLRTLDLSFCEALQRLPASLVQLRALSTLNLEGTLALIELPDLSAVASLTDVLTEKFSTGAMFVRKWHENGRLGFVGVMHQDEESMKWHGHITDHDENGELVVDAIFDEGRYIGGVFPLEKNPKPKPSGKQWLWED